MSHDSGKVHPKTKVLFGKLKQIAKMFDSIDDFDDLAKKMRKRKRNEEETSNVNEKHPKIVVTVNTRSNILQKGEKANEKRNF
ncbi:MAG: hypothetical protein EZS28_007994 [Streblomastix strix]|uniref:Uncharacterized protein n=1 Tax=Streblomastix strix TaxID=222440 RepID=A0A5J4WQ16_9EUKA|nr:MAG: hypothetical protein EZS28_007994 [Streblomastix strix]